MDSNLDLRQLRELVLKTAIDLHVHRRINSHRICVQNASEIVYTMDQFVRDYMKKFQQAEAASTKRRGRPPKEEAVQ